jgi:hypothetical protein
MNISDNADDDDEAVLRIALIAVDGSVPSMSPRSSNDDGISLKINKLSKNVNNIDSQLPIAIGMIST